MGAGDRYLGDLGEVTREEEEEDVLGEVTKEEEEADRPEPDCVSNSWK